jgi:hypothetical protein
LNRRRRTASLRAIHIGVWAWSNFGRNDGARMKESVVARVPRIAVSASSMSD